MRAYLGTGGKSTGGGITGYPLQQIYEEVAFLAYYMHWDYETLIHMEHRERQKWCEETGKINKKISGETPGNFFDV